MYSMRRREFIKAVTVTGLAGMAGRLTAAEDGASKVRVIVVHGKDPAKMLAAGVEKLGGWKAFVKEGKKVTLKPNIAWASRIEEGGNTHPDLVAACITACKAAGASEVVVPEKTCSDSKQSFAMSGIEEAVKKAGGRIYSADKPEHFRAVDLPQAKTLKKADVIVDVLDTPCLINMPVAKSHSAALLTLSMKNWMGVVKDRGFWHKNDLHQCIADCSTLIKPNLVIIDAIRIMVTGGPRGPGKLEHPEKLIFSTDPVAADAYAATLFKKDPFAIPSIKMAHEMKIGCGDLKQVDVVEIEA